MGSYPFFASRWIMKWKGHWNTKWLQLIIFCHRTPIHTNRRIFTIVFCSIKIIPNKTLWFRITETFSLNFAAFWKYRNETQCISNGMQKFTFQPHGWIICIIFLWFYAKKKFLRRKNPFWQINTPQNYTELSILKCNFSIYIRIRISHYRYIYTFK